MALARFLLAGFLLSFFSCAYSQNQICTDPTVVITTNLGDIHVQLSTHASPSAIQWLQSLINGPIYREGLSGEPVGYYHGLGFDYSKAKIDVRISARPPTSAILTPIQINAHSLDLHTKTIKTEGEAMQLWQNDLYPSWQKQRSQNNINSTLQKWADLFDKSMSAKFLVGMDKKTILEAKGFQFTQEVTSLPPVKGSVALVPASKAQATPALSFFLKDMPNRTGKWMVIGNVTEGFDILQKISELRGMGQHDYRDRKHRILDPVSLRNIQWICH